MYRFWEVAIKPILDALDPTCVVEIGSDHGFNTSRLLDHCKVQGTVLHVVDPLPKYNSEEWQEKHGDTLVFHKDLSLDALPVIEKPDLVLIDGDHNWYTVFNELKILEKNAEEGNETFPLVLLHDVGWPYGRRDLYYNPENIPQAYRQPYKQQAIKKGESQLSAGEGLNAHLCNADHEGGPRNGVRTAIEDFIGQSSVPLDLLVLPTIHGLGILIPTALKENNESLEHVLRSFDDLRAEESVTSELLMLVENERLKLEMQVEAFRTEVEASRTEVEAFRTEVEASRHRLRDLESSNKDLKQRLERAPRYQQAVLTLQETEREVRSQNKQLEKELETAQLHVKRLMKWMLALNKLFSDVLASRQWKAGRVLGEMYRRVSRGPSRRMAAQDMTDIFGRFSDWRTRVGLKNPVREDDDTVSAIALKARPRMSRQELIRRVRERLGEVPERNEWPFVSIIVLNRNGLSHLKTLFDALVMHTDYPAFEVVVVDNGSLDGSVEFLEMSDTPFKVKVIENEFNTTFSDGNNQGAEAASGDLLLFLNNDTEPMDDGWLKEMVDCSVREEAAAVGAYLVYTEAHDTQSEYAVQHRGIKFFNRNGFPQYYNLGNGEDALGWYLGVDSVCPAATAACLLISRDVFDEVGGYTSGYKYGIEDVDLGLKVTAANHKVVSCGRAVVFHHELTTQNVEGSNFMRLNRQSNRMLYTEKWGPALQRHVAIDALRGGGFWTEVRTHVALTVTSKNQQDGYGDWYTAHELGDALEDQGIKVSYVERKKDAWYSLPEDTDYLIVLIDLYDISRVSGVTTVAWIRNWTDRWAEHPWFDDFDIVLASSQTSKDIVQRKSNKPVTAIFPIAANPERFSRKPSNFSYESDYVFTGNYWGVTRLLNDLEVAPGEKFSIFGKGWPDVARASRYSRGAVPYDELPQVYSSTKLVIDETTTPTLPYGAVNSRVFDALATGTLVITNCVEGVRELFDADFPTYSSRRELREQLDLLLNDDEYRAELAGRYQGMVLQDHTYTRRAEQLTRILGERAKALSFCIKIGAPNREVAHTWGDLHFAKAMRKQFERRGHSCLIQTLGEWDNFEGLNYDVVIHLKGLTPYTPKPGQFNIMWNISHPEKTSGRECDGYDLVFVASESWAKELQNETRTPVLVLDQATDPDIFFPDFDEEHEHDLVFVGNSRKVRRRILDDLLPTEHDLAVWGGDWDGLIDDGYVVGNFLPNDQVRKAYSSAAIVLNDHWDDMREHGFISNRIYDALASGALVISDDLPGLKDRFGGAVVTYGSPEELGQLVDYYMKSPEARKQQARKGAEIVVAEHTFDKRIDRLIEEMTRILERDGRYSNPLSPAEDPRTETGSRRSFAPGR